MAEEKLNLFEFASGTVAKTGASAAKVMGGQMFKADSFRISFHCVPNHLGCHASILPSAILCNSSD
jgi:hypothetical protein